MTEEQTAQYVAFIAHFIKLLAEEKMSRTQAQQTAVAAASCLFAVMFALVPSDDERVDEFAAMVINAAINSYYGVQADPAMWN